MEKTKLLTITVVGLLLLNLGTLGFLFLNGKNHGSLREGRREPKQIIINKLHFDANQQIEYAKLIEWHHGEITRLDDNIRESKNNLYLQLNQNETNVKIKDSLIAMINSNQKQIETTHFKHFEDIKKLCYPNQMDAFNELTEELSQIFSRGQKTRGPRHD